MKQIDISGQIFSYWRVLEKSNGSLWECRCQCGEIRKIHSADLRFGKTKSCGCKKSALLSLSKSIHGKSKTRVYLVWKSMRARCSRVTCKDYPNYGGRGITVCDRWNTFNNFVQDMGEGRKGLMLERVDNNGNYEPGNCVWETAKIQTRNTRRNHNVEYSGTSMCLADACKASGINTGTVKSRLRYGWGIEKALSKNVRLHKQYSKRSEK